MTIYDPITDQDVEALFPENVVELLVAAVEPIDADFVVFRRPLLPSDVDSSVGIFATDWAPNNDSFEIGKLEQTTQLYQITIQILVIAGDAEYGGTRHSVLSTRVRRAIYRNQALREVLLGFSCTDQGVTETLQRMGINQQRFLSNEIEGSFTFLSVLNFWFETTVS